MAQYVSEGLPARLRAEMVVRDNFTCQRCKLSQEDGAKLHVHHKVPTEEGGPHTPENLITLCLDCHRDIHRDRTKKTCGIMLDLPWEVYDRLQPLGLENQLSFRKILTQSVVACLEEMAAKWENKKAP